VRALASLMLLVPSLALAERPLIAVVPFTGPQAKTAEATVVRALRHKASLVPPTTWEKSAKKLFAKSHNPDDIRSVAEDVARSSSSPAWSSATGAPGSSPSACATENPGAAVTS
jgi:hypothetical protein